MSDLELNHIETIRKKEIIMVLFLNLLEMDECTYVASSHSKKYKMPPFSYKVINTFQMEFFNTQSQI